MSEIRTVATQPRTMDEIEQDLAATRQRLAATIEEVTDRVAPKNIAARLKARAKGLVVDDRGALRTQRVAVAGGATAAVVGAVVGIVVWRRRR